jgi:hypothetical protein
MKNALFRIRVDGTSPFPVTDDWCTMVKTNPQAEIRVTRKMGRKISAGPISGGTEYMDRLTAGLLRRKLSSKPAAHKQSIMVLKFSVLFSLLVVAGLIGYGAYAVVENSERTQFLQAYKTLISEIIPSTNIGNAYATILPKR